MELLVAMWSGALPQQPDEGVRVREEGDGVAAAGQVRAAHGSAHRLLRQQHLPREKEVRKSQVLDQASQDGLIHHHEIFTLG